MSSVAIGLTGGIGAGKSTVALLMADRGAQVIDVDALGRLVLEPGGGAFDGVVAAFGSEILNEVGAIDRPALARIVFGEQGRLGELEAISHPVINDLIGAALAESSHEVVVLDMAVLTESGLGQRNGVPMYDRVIVVESHLDVRLPRLLDRGMTAGDARERMAAQATDRDRRMLADLVVVNDDDLAHLERAIAGIWPTVEAWSLQCKFAPNAGDDEG